VASQIIRDVTYEKKPQPVTSYQDYNAIVNSPRKVIAASVVEGPGIKRKLETKAPLTQESTPERSKPKHDHNYQPQYFKQ
jgi:hypothetical protein